MNYATGHLDMDDDHFIAERFPVTSVTIDEIVKIYHFFPDVIKIDVEGAELLVLKGAEATLKEGKTQIFLSTHSQDLRNCCLEYLDNLGFVSKAIDINDNDPSEFFVKPFG